MKKFFPNIPLFTLLFLVSISFAQDIHFSQYYLSPLTLNPANTGNYRGDYRLMGNYRTQWRELNAFNSFSAGGDFNVFPKNMNFSGGIIFLNDKSGGNLTVNKILPSAAYHIKLNGYKLHFGLQPGLVIKSIDFYSHSFPNQLNWEKGGFDNRLPNNEPNAGQRFAYFDLNLGSSVSKRFGKWEPEFGFALFHINRPNESFLSDKKNPLPIRQAHMLKVNYHVNQKVILQFHNMYGYTAKSSDWVSGVNLEYVLSQHAFFTNSVFGGLMWRSGILRNSDAGIATIGFNFKNYTLGFSYDVTFSQLKTTVNSRGAFEMALIYRGKSTRLNQKVIPCERY